MTGQELLARVLSAVSDALSLQHQTYTTILIQAIHSENIIQIVHHTINKHDAFYQRKKLSIIDTKAPLTIPRFPSRTEQALRSWTGKTQCKSYRSHVLSGCSAKKQVTEQGGKITTEFKLIKGFTYDGCL